MFSYPVRRCYCAFCRSDRRIYNKRHVTMSNVIMSLMAAFTAMFIVWQNMDARVSILFVVFLFASEVFIQFRWRTSLPCPHCGFDPIIYLRTPERAAEKVKQHLQQRQNDPMVLLSSKARLNIPVRRVKADNGQVTAAHLVAAAKKSNQSTLVSRRV